MPRQFKICANACRRWFDRSCFHLRATEASTLAEFAIALPLLVVLVVGIFDFGAAFNLKQELNNAVREGARYGASQPSNDLYNTTTPPSVDAIRSLVASYLLAAGVNDCGLNTTSGVGGGSLFWSYTATGNGCPNPPGLKLEIHRSVGEQEGTTGVYLICTELIIRYPYQWHFNSVIQLLVPGANYGLTTIQSQAYAANVD